MKKYFLILLCIIYTAIVYSQQPRIQNTQLTLKGDKLFITYDITGTKPLEKVWIEVTKPDGSIITPKTLTGDTGHVTAGTDKQMVWDMQADGYDFGDMEISVKITSEKSIFISDTKGTFTDPRDGETYEWVRIGRQVWMAENLRATEYNDGMPIPNVTGNKEWKKLKKDDRAWCYYENDKKNRNKYGVLYTWAAAMNGTASSNSNPSGVQGVCPDGWHLPSDAEWEKLKNFISNDGHAGSEGNALIATSDWRSGGNGTDDYGFSGILKGNRNIFGTFDFIGFRGDWWSATERGTYHAWSRTLFYFGGDLYKYHFSKERGFSVRCLQN